jgi:hypothetical protein
MVQIPQEKTSSLTSIFYYGRTKQITILRANMNETERAVAS